MLFSYIFYLACKYIFFRHGECFNCGTLRKPINIYRNQKRAAEQGYVINEIQAFPRCLVASRECTGWRLLIQPLVNWRDVAVFVRARARACYLTRICKITPIINCGIDHRTATRQLVPENSNSGSELDAASRLTGYIYSSARVHTLLHLTALRSRLRYARLWMHCGVSTACRVLFAIDCLQTKVGALQTHNKADVYGNVFEGEPCASRGLESTLPPLGKYLRSVV